MPSPERVARPQLSSPLHSSSHVWPAGQPRVESEQASSPPQEREQPYPSGQSRVDQEQARKLRAAHRRQEVLPGAQLELDRMPATVWSLGDWTHTKDYLNRLRSPWEVDIPDRDVPLIDLKKSAPERQ